MNTDDKHSWKPELPEDWGHGIGIVIVDVCVICGCKRAKGKSKHDSYCYQRSGIAYDVNRPNCTDMSRRNNEILD